MDVLPLILGVSNTSVALLSIGLAIPLLKGQVQRNRWYGVRLPQSFASDEAWLVINRFGARRLIVWSVPLLLFGIATFFLPLGSHLGAIVATSLAPLILLIPAVESWFFAARYAAQTRHV